MGKRIREGSNVDFALLRRLKRRRIWLGVVTGLAVFSLLVGLSAQSTNKAHLLTFVVNRSAAGVSDLVILLIVVNLFDGEEITESNMPPNLRK